MTKTKQYLATVAKNFERLGTMAEDIDQAASLCVDALRAGGKIIFAAMADRQQTVSIWLRN